MRRRAVRAWDECPARPAPAAGPPGMGRHPAGVNALTPLGERGPTMTRGLLDVRQATDPAPTALASRDRAGLASAKPSCSIPLPARRPVVPGPGTTVPHRR